MNKQFILLFLLIFNIANCQINNQLLINEWIKVKTRMIDGSKDVSEAFLSSKFYRWKISTEKFSSDSEPINSNVQNFIKYKLENNFMRTSTESGYEIEKLTSDSLVIIQRTNGINEADKIKKFWFIKSSIIRNNFLEKHKNDSIIIANEHFTPTLNRNFISEINKNFQNKNKFPNLNLVGNIILYPKEKKVEMEIINFNDRENIKNQKNIDLIKSIIEKTFDFWNLTDFMSFKKIYVPFVIKSTENYTNGITFRGASLHFFINNVDDLSKIYGIKLQDLNSSQENFNNGIIAFQDNKFDKALKYFIKSYEIDNRKIDALYNIVAIYSLKNDNINACIYLKKLKDLEQTEGTKIYNEKCSN